MRRFIQLITSKKILGAVFLLIQLAMFYLGFYALREYSLYILGGEKIIGAVAIIFIVNNDSDSGYKLSWVFLIAVMSIFGVCLYFYVRTDFAAGRIRKELKAVNDATAYLNNQDGYELSKLLAENNADSGVLSFLNDRGGFPPYANTEAKYYPLGDDAVYAIIEQLRNARKFIFMEFFIINEKSSVWQEIFRVLRSKVKEGVEVRLLYDSMGSMTTTSAHFCDNLRSAGINCYCFSPLKPFLSTYQNNRDHRKIVVIDGITAFTGGINLADEYVNKRKLYGHWKDNAIMIKGDAVKSFGIMFLRMWSVVSGSSENYEKYVGETDYEHRNFDDGHIIPFDDNPFRSDRLGKTLYTDIINSSRDYVYIMTPYLVLDESMRESIKYAAKRGVDVRIIMPHIPDKWYAFALARTYYPELIEAGVNIHEYTHGFVHSKTIVSDGIKAVVGTINFDYRSLYLNYECAVYLYANSAITDIEKDFRQTIERCKLFTENDYYATSLYKRFIGRILRIFAPQM